MNQKFVNSFNLILALAVIIAAYLLWGQLILKREMEGLKRQLVNLEVFINSNSTNNVGIGPDLELRRMVFSINGQVKNVVGNKVLVTAHLIDWNSPWSDPKTPLIIDKDYEVLISEATELNLVSSLDLTKKSLITLDRVRVGDNISISAGEDIQNKTSFIAKEIVLFKK